MKRGACRYIRDINKLETEQRHQKTVSCNERPKIKVYIYPKRFNFSAKLGMLIMIDSFSMFIFRSSCQPRLVAIFWK